MQTITTNLFAPMTKVLLFIAGVFLATMLSLFVFAQAAHADGGIGGGGGGDIDVGGGGAQPPASGIGTDTPDTPRPSGGSTGATLPDFVTPYQMACNNWSGAGSWKPGTNCVTTSDGVISAAPGEPKRGWGTSKVYPGMKFGTYVVNNGQTCGPSGLKSAYGQNWRRVVSDYVEVDSTYRWNRNFGWVKVSSSQKLMGQYISYYSYGCLYPTDSYSQTVCFWNYGGNAKYSIDRTRNLSAWTHYGDRPKLGSDPRVPTGGSGTTPPNCDRTGSANVYYKTQTNPLGYYKMLITYNYKVYTKLAWIAWGNQEVYAQWSQGGTQNGSATTYWTHTCRPGAPNATEGPYNNQGAIPNLDRYTNPATCPQVTWQCKLGTPTTVGLDRNAVLGGTLSPTTKASAMRNGEKVNIDFANVRIVDTSSIRDVDVTDGGTSPGVKDVTNISYKTEVKPGSTPFYGTDANSGTQYFKYYSKRTGTTTEKFGSWLNNNNANQDKAISFNWASESSTQGFVLQRTYRVTASFLVPQGGDMGTGGAGAAKPYTWKVGTYDCHDYSGRGNSRVDRGILTSSSNPITVVRATNK
jgi:hypothetical protein